MKKKQFHLMFAIVFFLILISVGSSVCADPYELKAGIGFLYSERADNLWGGGHKRIDNIYDKPRSKTSIMLLPLIEVRRAEKNGNELTGTDLYLNTTMEPGSISLGAKLRFEKSFIDVYGFYSFTARNWENPYVPYRKSARTGYYGGKITYSNIFNTKFSLSYRGAQTDVEKDIAGRLYRDLRQDGYTHTIGLAYKFNLSDRIHFVPDILLERGAFEGKSNAYNSFEGGLGFEVRADDIAIGTRIYGKKTRFDGTHPIYTRKRIENMYGGNIVATFNRPFGLTKYALIASLGGNVQDSHINFFDGKGYSTFLALVYKY